MNIINKGYEKPFLNNPWLCCTVWLQYRPTENDVLKLESQTKAFSTQKNGEQMQFAFLGHSIQ